MAMKKGFTQKEVDSFKREYAQSLERAINEIAEIAWTNGIEIVRIRLKDNQIQSLQGLFGYGDRAIIEKPHIKQYSTDFMDIEVIE